MISKPKKADRVGENIFLNHNFSCLCTLLKVYEKYWKLLLIQRHFKMHGLDFCKFFNDHLKIHNSSIHDTYSLMTKTWLYNTYNITLWQCSSMARDDWARCSTNMYIYNVYTFRVSLKISLFLLFSNKSWWSAILIIYLLHLFIFYEKRKEIWDAEIYYELKGIKFLPQTLILESIYLCNPVSETLDISNYAFW